MGERSSSGVRNIRAMFEAKSETTSPPSRGRSPAGSEGAQSINSRPISKVRASFVAVERSGQLGPQLGLRKMSDSGDAGLDSTGVADSRASTLASHQRSVAGLENGATSTLTGQESGTYMAGLKLEGSNSGGKAETDVIHGSEAATEFTVKSVPFSSKESAAAQTATKGGKRQSELLTDPCSGPTHALNEAPSDLGIVLKGSPFEPGEESEPGRHKVQDSASSSKTLTRVADGAAALDKNIFKPTANGKPHPKSTAPPATKATSAKPSAISTKPDAQRNQKSGAAQTSSHSVKTSKPLTPKTPTVPSKQVVSKAVSPKLLSNNSLKQPMPEKISAKTSETRPECAPMRKISRTSLASQSSRTEPKARHSTVGTTQTSKRAAPASSLSKQSTSGTASSAPLAKDAPPSSPPNSKKPAPKSPIRPIRLPASVTAAKLGGNAPSRSPSRASTVGTSIDRKPSTKKDRTSTVTRGPPSATPASFQKKSSRPSLPAGLHLNDRPKSRTSAAGSKAPDEGFLARMMRPTTSSANKVHEKLEPKSPPRKVHSNKPKRNSGGTDEGKSVLAESEPVTAPVPTAADSKGQDEGAMDDYVEAEGGTVNGAGPSTEALAT